MSRTSASLFAALLVCSQAAFAQSVTFRGKVEDVSGTQNQFFVDCTNTSLTSSAFNLNGFVGQQVEISGDWNGSFASPSVNVLAIAAVPETFEIGGGAKIGKVSNLTFTAAPGTAVVGRLSGSSAFVPLTGAGVLFINPASTLLGLSGTVGGSGILQINFAIPNNPALVGFELHGQGALFQAGGVTLTNPDCKAIDN